MSATDVSCPRSVVLAPAGPLREPTRPPGLREPGFEDAFDATTLIFDAFEESERRTRLICPPLSNLARAVSEATFTAVDDERRLPFEYRPGHLQDQIIVERTARTGPFRMSTAFGEFRVDPAPDRSRRFQRRRVLLTVQKDNAIVWIQDWMRFHRDVHGADAVLLFDNESTRYDICDLARSLDEVDGFEEVEIVSWPFRYGPQSDHQRGLWDSAFTQVAALETARRSFLASAWSVLSGDIDELVVPVTASTVFEAAERSRWGVVAYHGLWVPQLTSDPQGCQLRHRDMRHYERPPFGLRYGWLPGRQYFENKFTAVPSRLPETALWNAHAIRGYPQSRLTSRRFHVAHYRAITTNWKYDRIDSVEFDRSKHRRSPFLSRALDRIDWDR